MDVIFLFESFTKSFLSLAQGVIQVRSQNGIGRSVYDGSEDAMFSSADHEATVIFPFNAVFSFAWVFAATTLRGDFFNGRLHFSCLRVADWVVAGIGNH